MTRDEIETALDRGRLQVCGDGRVKWYDIRRNGATKTWKRNPNKVEIPCKVGFRECFRLAGQLNGQQNEGYYGLAVWRWNYAVRVRPANFDPRKRI